VLQTACNCNTSCTAKQAAPQCSANREEGGHAQAILNNSSGSHKSPSSQCSSNARFLYPTQFSASRGPNGTSYQSGHASTAVTRGTPNHPPILTCQPPNKLTCTAGISIRLSTPPSDGAMYGIRTASMKRAASQSPPATWQPVARKQSSRAYHSLQECQQSHKQTQQC
jgi:hypothetical protein